MQVSFTARNDIDLFLVPSLNIIPFCNVRFEPDMLAFSGCYYGGGEKERRELGALRKRWKGLHVCMLLCYHMVGTLENQDRIP
jgi:hypothetical protein